MSEPGMTERERLAVWCEIQAAHADDHADVSRSKARGPDEDARAYHAEMATDYANEAKD